MSDEQAPAKSETDDVQAAPHTVPFRDETSDVFSPDSVPEEDEEDTATGFVDQAEDLVREATPDLPQAPVMTPPKRFWPWHKPRKHYVRLKQWCAHTRQLIKDLNLSPERQVRPLRYLTLPGDELLDIRTLHGICEQAGVDLQYLGYNATGKDVREVEIDLSDAEVKSLKRIYAPGSLVVKDRIEDITRPATVAYQTAVRRAPFDVINLDACSSVIGSPPLAANSILQTVANLVHLQLQTRAEPWLLFLTTIISRSAVDRRTLDELIEQVLKNAEASSSFLASMGDQLGLSSDDLLKDFCNGEGLEHAQLVQVFIVGFGKWLLRLVGPNWSVELLDSFGYQVGPNPMDMLSLSFRFYYCPPQAEGDPTGLTLPAPTFFSSRAKPPSEPEAAVAMVKKTVGIQDLDRLLGDNPELLQKITEKAAKIMVQARHQEAAYYAWVQAGCPVAN